MFDLYGYLIKSCISRNEEVERLTRLTNKRNKIRILKIIKNESIKFVYSNDEIFLMMIRDVNNFIELGYSCYKAIYIARSKRKNEHAYYLLIDQCQNNMWKMGKIIREIERKKEKRMKDI